MKQSKHRKVEVEKVAKGIIFALLVSVLILPEDQNLMDPVLLPKFMASTFFLLILLIYSLFIPKSPVLKGWKDPLILLYLLFFAISLISVLYSIYPIDGLFEWLKMAYGIIFLWLMIKIKPEKTIIVYTSICISFLAIISVLIQLASLGSHFDFTLHTTYLVSGPFGHKNLLGQILLLTFPFSVWAAFRLQNLMKYLGLFNVITSIFLIVILLSRGVWVSFLGALAGTGMVYAYLQMAQGKLTENPLNRRAVVGIAVGVCLVLVGLGVFFSQTNHDQTISERAQSVVDLNNVHTKDRIGLWQRSWQLFLEKPIIGHGMGSWKVEVVRLGTHGLKTSGGEINYVRPHNDYLWVLSEQGLIGFIPYLGLLVLGLWYCIRNIYQEQKSSLFHFALLFSYLSFLGVSFFSFPRERIEHIFLFHLFLAAILQAKWERENKEPSQSQWGKLGEKVVLGVVVMIILLGGWCGWKRYQGESKISKAQDLQNRSQWDRALKELESIDLFWMPMDRTATPVELYIGSVYISTYQPKDGCINYQRAFEKHPWHPMVLNGLARCYKMSGQIEKAEEFYLKALTITPENNHTLLGLSAMYWEQDNKQIAIETLKKISPRWEDPGYDLMLKQVIKFELDSIKSQYPNAELTRYLNDSIQIFPKIDFIYRESIYRKTSLKEELEKYIQ